jgi:hypothetical protein
MKALELSVTHSDLVKRAGRWLKSLGCSVILEEQVAYVYNGETPDAIGWKSNHSIVVEVKVSRSDFLRDQKKRFRGKHLKGMGGWRFYLVPQGLLREDECPEGWGIYEVRGRRVCHFAGVDYRNAASAPFVPCLRSERAMLISAVRRLSKLG